MSVAQLNEQPTTDENSQSRMDSSSHIVEDIFKKETPQFVSVEDAFKLSGGHGCYQFNAVGGISIPYLLIMLYVFSVPYFLIEPSFECTTQENPDWHSCTSEEICDSVNFKTLGNHKQTFLSEFSLFCSENYLKGFPGSSYFFGNLIGTLVFSQMADFIGRLRSMYLGVIGNMIFIVSIIFVGGYNIWCVIVFSGILGIAVGFIVSTPVTYLLESMSSKYSNFYTTYSNAWYAFGELIIAGIMYANLSWREMLYCNIGISSTFFIFAILLRETPRYYIGKGKYQQAISQFRKISKINRAILPAKVKLIESLDQEQDQEKQTKKYTIIDVFRYKSTRYKFVTLMPIFLFTSLVYFGISMYLPNLSGNIYLNGLTCGIAEIIGVIISGLLADKIGRKTVLSLFYFICGVAYILYFSLPLGTAGKLGFIFVAKLFISGSYNILTVFVMELFPTIVKSSSYGCLVVVARVGGSSSPIFVNMVNPILIFGILALFNGGLSLFLPETLGKQMYDQFDEITEKESFMNDTNKQSIQV